ncbi:hypothetical protein Sru01_03900 [Sphaerisporangium rufum]|uniref:Secreted protein n=1 Tax=Sphaerisporangium rufum TaxID=1381558 RepID=A0A919QX11_9ACTN|nr:DUF5719 family protein [Sphaerisporangium rufum]GII75408.1 hypothetical protein Sru01_03900 [Sphaerisporangium rufum]
MTAQDGEPHPAIQGGGTGPAGEPGGLFRPRSESRRTEPGPPEPDGGPARPAGGRRGRRAKADDGLDPVPEAGPVAAAGGRRGRRLKAEAVPDPATGGPAADDGRWVAAGPDPAPGGRRVDGEAGSDPAAGGLFTAAGGGRRGRRARDGSATDPAAGGGPDAAGGAAEPAAAARRAGSRGGGARRALLGHRLSFVALVLACAGLLYGVAHLTRPPVVAPQAVAPVKVAVRSVSTVCPDPADARVSAITPAGAPGTGAATVTELGAAAARPQRLDRPGVLWQREIPRGSGPLEVAGSGAMAAGLEAAQTTRRADGASRGLAGVRCVEPGASAWFAGPGPATADVRLYLANADTAPTTVSIMVYSGEGPVAGETGDGVVLAPGEHRTVSIRDLAPSPLVMAVQVRTVSGRVAAAVRAVLGKGEGTDWLPAAAEPATTVVVPGIPGGGGKRELYVAAPGAADTVVRIKALTADGFYAMKNRETAEVPAGSAVSLDLSTGIGGQPSAVVLTADVPIVAGLMATGTGVRPDVAFSAGAVPIDVGSVVADNRGGKKTSSRLILSAPAAAGKVRVQAVPERGAAPPPVEVPVPAGRTAEVKLAAPAGGGDFAVVVLPLPGSGPVYGGRVLDERAPGGLLLTAQPLARARTFALVPPVVESPAAVLPPIPGSR